LGWNRLRRFGSLRDENLDWVQHNFIHHLNFVFVRIPGMDRVPLRPLGYATAFEEILDPGERVLWAGQPRQGIYFRASDFYLIPFSIMWGGFAIFWEYSVLTNFGHGRVGRGGAPIIFPLWGIPFVLIGLYMMVGRFFFDAWQRRRIWYGVTDRRALIVRTSLGRKFTSFDLRTIGEVSFQQHSDGTGTLTFGPAVSVFMQRNRSMNLQGAANNAFDHTPDAAEAYRVVRQVQQTPAGQMGS